MPLLLRQLTKQSIPIEKQNSFPFNTPIIQSLENITFSHPVSFFVGENGTGKSTVLEGIAARCNLPIIGSKNMNQDKALQYASELGQYFKLSWSIQTHRGFFLRSEDFFGFTKRLNRLRAELNSEVQRLDQELPDGYGKNIAIGSIKGQLTDLTTRYGVDLDAGSHGESFLKLFQSRIQPNGLYLLDEPETPLSPTRQMSLLRIIFDTVKKGCQFIIATHSPIIMAYPKAHIFNFNSLPIHLVSYNEVDHVKITRDFLDHKEHFLSELFR